MLKLRFVLVFSVILLSFFYPFYAVAATTCSSELANAARNEFRTLGFKTAHSNINHEPVAWLSEVADLRTANTVQALVKRYKAELAKEVEQVGQYDNQIAQAQLYLDFVYKTIGPSRYQLLRLGIVKSTTRTYFSNDFSPTRYTFVRDAIIRPLVQRAQAKVALRRLKATAPPSAVTFDQLRRAVLDAVRQFVKIYASGPQNFEKLKIGRQVYISYNDPYVDLYLETLVYFNGKTYHFVAGLNAGQFADAWIPVEQDKLRRDPNYYSIFDSRVLRPARGLMDFDKYDSGPGYDWPL